MMLRLPMLDEMGQIPRRDSTTFSRGSQNARKRHNIRETMEDLKKISQAKIKLKAGYLDQGQRPARF